MNLYLLGSGSRNEVPGSVDQAFLVGKTGLDIDTIIRVGDEEANTNFRGNGDSIHPSPYSSPLPMRHRDRPLRGEG
jgi:hypothetical protein